MKAVRRFKGLLSYRRAEIIEPILGQDARIVAPPESIKFHRPTLHTAYSVDVDDRIPIEQVQARKGIHRKIDVDKPKKSLSSRDDAAIMGRGIEKSVLVEQLYSDMIEDKGALYPATKRKATTHTDTAEEFHGKGQAHDPLSEEFHFLAVGPSANQYSRTPLDTPPIVSESPSAAEGNIYEEAYHQEVERIRKDSDNTTVYMTRRIQDQEKYKDDQNMLGIGEDKLRQTFRRIADKAKDAREEHAQDDHEAGLKKLVRGGASSTGLKKITEAAVKDLKNGGQDSQGQSSSGIKRLADAAMKDLRNLQHDNDSKSEADATKDGGGSAIKATVQDLKAEHEERQMNKSEEGGRLSEFKSAIRDVKQNQRDKHSATDEEQAESSNMAAIPAFKGLIDTLSNKKKKEDSEGE